jgi:hypothetical protein
MKDQVHGIPGKGTAKRTEIRILLDGETVEVKTKLAPPHDAELPEVLRQAHPQNVRELTRVVLRWVLVEMEQPKRVDPARWSRAAAWLAEKAPPSRAAEFAEIYRRMEARQPDQDADDRMVEFTAFLADFIALARPDRTEHMAALTMAYAQLLHHHKVPVDQGAEAFLLLLRETYAALAGLQPGEATA